MYLLPQNVPSDWGYVLSRTSIFKSCRLKFQKTAKYVYYKVTNLLDLIFDPDVSGNLILSYVNVKINR